MSNNIILGYSATDWQTAGLKEPLIWDTEKVPHALISGTTGGGKTVLAQSIVNKLLDLKVDIFCCDFKSGGDWDGIVKNYGEYTDCDRVLDIFYCSFCDAIREKRHEEKYLLFDEFSSFAMSKDSKGFKELMGKVSHLAFMGRSFGYHLILISQQFNAKVLDTAIREQFGIKIYMGSTISTESAAMLFPNCEIDKSVHLPRFCGYISMPERDLETIMIPYIEKPERLKKLLIQKGNARQGANETL